MLCLVRQHDLRILSLAAVIVLFTLFTSTELWRRRRRGGQSAAFWLGATAFCSASGIWAVHFVAVLAYLPGVQTGFRLAPTLGSLALMLAAAVMSFFGGVHARTAAVRAVFGAILGLGIAGMHYLGMAGLLVPGHLTWSTPEICLAIAGGAAFCALGFHVGLNGRRWSQILPGAALIALGVLALHFVSMEALTFTFDPRVAPPRAALSRMDLALLVGGLTVLVLLLGLASLVLSSREQRRARGRLTLLFENSFEGVALVDGGRLREVSRTLADMLGMRRHDLVGCEFPGDLFRPDSGSNFTCSGRTEGLLAAKGGPLPVELLCKPLGDSEDNLVIAFRDLTERRQKEQSLSLLFDRNPAPVWVADLATGEILMANPAACRLYGYTPEAFLKLRSRDLLPAEEFERVLSLLRAGRTGGYSPDRVWRHLTASGEEILVLPYTEGIHFEDRAALLTTVFDVTDRERTAQALRLAKEAAEASSEAKSIFLANMSHEIRTPLNGILGMAQALAAESLPETQRTRVDVIRDSGRALLTILNDILDVSRIESGAVELEVISFDLGDLLTRAASAFAPMADDKRLALRLDLSPALAPTYRGDPGRLRQIVANLLSNAVKFTESGSVTLAAEPASEGVRIAVTDTGPGVESSRLAAIFDKFVQADPSTTRRFGGTGLGLTISRNLARLMGGDLQAQSVTGEGSTFSVVLPLAADLRAEAADAPSAAARAEAAPTAEPEFRVLAAEDNPVNQLVLKTLLKQAGLEVVMVDDGLAALEAWRSLPWDLILMDVQMPVMDGMAAAAAIRAEEAASGRPRTPILAVTANVMAHQLERYRTIGMDGCVGKPLDARALFEAIDTAMEPDAGASAAA